MQGTATIVTEPPARLFTRKEYHAMMEAGILGEQDRVELIKGRIIAMMPIGPWHASAADRLTEALRDRYGKTVIVSCNRPTGCGDDSEPQADVSILRRRDDFYACSHPVPEDVILMVEIADSSRVYDLGTKHDLYAEHKVQEYWVVDGKRRCVHVFREPLDGMFRETRIYQLGESIPLPECGDATLPVAETGLSTS